jgi:hypothetical protein
MQPLTSMRRLRCTPGLHPIHGSSAGCVKAARRREALVGATEGISAHGHAEERAQTGTCLTAKGLSDGQEGARESSCPLGFERQQVGEALSKCASWTGLVIAEEAAHLEQEPNRLSTHGQIAWGAEIAAMNALRELAAGRADTLVDVVCADMTRAVGV